MHYKEAIQYLNSFVDYEKIGYKEAGIFSVDRMRKLAHLFDNPEKSFQAIHITGTKGKGSVASFVFNILKDARFRVGLYTSPHLVTPRERIRFNDEMISEDDLVSSASEIKDSIGKHKLGFSPTYFEIYTLLAFNYFRKKKIDFGVIEVGLGGRLDATNIVKSASSVITPISYDHTEILGNTLEKIAEEKTDIIKKDSIVISAPQSAAVLDVIKKKCKAQGVELVLVGKDIRTEDVYHDSGKEIFNIETALARYENCESRLLGAHQVMNAASAVGAAEALIKKGVKISKENIKNGIKTTGIPARCEVVSVKPYIVLDGAQNKKSAEALKETIKRNFKYKRLILILGVSRGKDIKGICEELAPLANEIVLTKAKTQRAECPRDIGNFIKGKNIFFTDSVREAIKKAEAQASVNDMILVTGSFFVIGEAKEIGFAKEKLTV